MKGRVIAVANMKGGVGKTATVVGLAEALAVAGHEVLVIDLDAQANASMCIAGDLKLARLIEKARTIDAFVEDYMLKGRQIRFADCIRGEASDVTHLGAPLPIALLASSPALRLVERELIYKLTKQKFDLDQIVSRLWEMMRDELKRTKKPYDVILIDCAPGISALTEVSIRLADLVIVPTIPDPLSSYGLQAFCNSLWDGQLAKRSPLKPPKARPHVLITRRRPIREHARMADILRQESYRENPAFSVFATEIPERAAIATALGKTGTSPAFTGKWGDEAVAVLHELAAETLEAFHGE